MAYLGATKKTRMRFFNEKALKTTFLIVNLIGADMKKRATVLLVVLALLFSAVTGAQFVNLSKANPSVGDSNLPQVPDKTPPQIIINTPQKNQTFTVNSTIPYSITIKIPSSWFENQSVGSHGSLHSVSYSIDGSESLVTVAGVILANGSTIASQVARNGSEPAFIPTFSEENPVVNLTGTLPALPIGRHNIMVWVSWLSLYHPTDTPQNYYGWQTSVYEYPMATHSNITAFSVVNKTVETDNSFTEPVNRPQESEVFPTTLFLVAFMATVALVVAGLLVYHKKHKRKTKTV